MADLITEYTEYDSFAREWHSGTLADYEVSLEKARDRGLLNEQPTRQLWQLLGRLDSDELLVQLPEWLATEKLQPMERTTPTTFVGSISRETEDAILFESSAAARPLMGLAHRMHSLEKGIERTANTTDRHDQLVEQFRALERKFTAREDLPSLSEEWLPKSQLITAIRRQA